MFFSKTHVLFFFQQVLFWQTHVLCPLELCLAMPMGPHETVIWIFFEGGRKRPRESKWKYAAYCLRNVFQK